jgi:vitamin B12 transporter
VAWNFRWQKRNGSYVSYIDLQPGERVDYAPFSILDVQANYKLNNIDLFINANNIFNTKYVDLGNIPQPGFWLSGGAAIKL